MNRRPFPFSLAAADSAISSAAAMYSRPYFRGGRRGYSDRPVGPATVDQADFVSGDSHFRAVRETNRGFRPNYNAVPPPPQYATGQQFNGPRSQSPRAGPPVFQNLTGPPRPYRHPRPMGPAVGNYQPFRPPQQAPQQYRPRASKPPDYRDWEYGKPGLPSHCERFTVLSYNILADYLAIDHYHKLYFHIPRYIMDWNWRKNNICFELGLWSADILCFQEVDRFQDLEAELKPRGYAGIWKMRTGDPVDGCAIFWRVSRFKLLHEESIEYNKLGLRDNVAQICVFESLKGQSNSNGGSTLSTRQVGDSSARSNRVVVCNIHVLFNPKRGEIKLGQIRTLLDRAHAVSKLWDDAPVVFCGDFNCTPKSPIYNFITERKLDLSELARDKVSGQASAEIHPPRPAYPEFRTQAADNSTQASVVNCEKIEQTNLPLDAQNLACPQSSTNTPSTEMPENHSSSLTTNTPNPTLKLNGPSEKLFPDSVESASCESTSIDLVLDGKFESLSLDESVDGATDKIGEDCDSFLSELQSSTGQIPSQFHEDGILNDNLHVEHEIITDVGNSFYNPSAWTPAEMQTATGSADNKIVEHPLKLTSAYADVENSSGLRDSCGEPFVTSYHRRFSGTVDYIWHTQGLQTAKILAPIPKHVMHQTRGFPTKKWGSDHIALVSEFAFANDISSENVSQ
ncbi:carbon catabolite repressor protein 4 homolog 6 [Phtheirospermum japonicum]|uniref:Carbon catabolite repressor protein 4 homolog 6 n=1 Tax=Phtheirospermum japonicum TaxID=374723 RepID=A0A830D183_9LAMI|nr:carbon catabolite repressor protein 4 homolog 6 [Phtheirospermum japonicum]